MEYDWEDDQYEGTQGREAESTSYTLEDMLGCLPIEDARLKFDPGMIKVYREAERLLAEDGESWRSFVLDHCRKEADLEAEDIYSEYDDICVITYPHGGFTVVTKAPQYG